MRVLVGWLLLAMCACLGLAVLLSPFLAAALVQGRENPTGWSGGSPGMLILLLSLALLILLYEVQSGLVNAKLVALLGVLTAMNAALRFIEVAIPGPGGFTPIFFLIILTGYVYGARFGFILGAMTLFVSALITGGVGPWLPGQMFTAGWMGMTAPVCRWIVGRRGRGSRFEIISLMIFGAIWGILYGVIMNLWSWPFFIGPAEQSWAAGVSFSDLLKRYLIFYMTTSLYWDLAASGGNILLLGFFGVPTLKALRRFREKFFYTYSLVIQSLPSTANQAEMI
mgnify:CR=1 FL=1